MTDTAPFDARFDDDAVEALLSGQGDGAVAAAVCELRRSADRPVPTPSAALAALLASGLPLDTAPIDDLARRRRRRYVALGIAAGGATTIALTGVAAANDALPSPAQGVVTDIVNNFTPFDITPGHDHRRGGGVQPTDTKLPGAGR